MGNREAMIADLLSGVEACRAALKEPRIRRVRRERAVENFWLAFSYVVVPALLALVVLFGGGE